MLRPRLAKAGGSDDRAIAQARFGDFGRVDAERVEQGVHDRDARSELLGALRSNVVAAGHLRDRQSPQGEAIRDQVLHGKPAEAGNVGRRATDEDGTYAAGNTVAGFDPGLGAKYAPADGCTDEM